MFSRLKKFGIGTKLCSISFRNYYPCVFLINTLSETKDPLSQGWFKRSEAEERFEGSFWKQYIIKSLHRGLESGRGGCLSSTILNIAGN